MRTEGRYLEEVPQAECSAVIFDKTRTKIVCTIGPASRSKKTLTKMIEAGMDVARINLSHEDHPSAKKTFKTIRSVDDSIPIMFDIQGPKIRIGELRAPVELKSGKEFTISIEDFIGDEKRVSISHKELPNDVQPGDMIAINDGIVRLQVKYIQGDEVVTEVIHGGVISTRKGVNVPGIELSCRMPTDQDRRDLDLAAELLKHRHGPLGPVLNTVLRRRLQLHPKLDELVGKRLNLRPVFVEKAAPPLDHSVFNLRAPRCIQFVPLTDVLCYSTQGQVHELRRKPKTFPV